MATDTTINVLKAIRARLLNFVPTVGATLDTRLSSRLYIVQAPDNVLASAAYGLMRLINLTAPVEDHGLKLVGDLEIMLFGRPRSAQQAVSDAADVVMQALYSWLASGGSATNGYLYTMTPTRDDLPPFSDPADRELVQIRILAPVSVWPQYLLQYATAAA